MGDDAELQAHRTTLYDARECQVDPIMEIFRAQAATRGEDDED